MQTLEPCPFCAQPLTVRGGINPYGFCETDGCWLSGARIGISCDDPKQVERWNTRPTPAAPVSPEPNDAPYRTKRVSGYFRNLETGLVRYFANGPRYGKWEFDRHAPVSPDATGKCGELVTVMRRYRGTDWPDHYPWAFLNEIDCQGEAGPRWIIEELCLRSQAVELLAAERAKYRDAMEKLVDSQRETLVWQQQAIDLKADNAAKTARVKELEQRCEDWSKSYAEKCSDYEALKRRTDTLEAKLVAAEKALDIIFKNPRSGTAILDARAALGGKPS